MTIDEKLFSILSASPSPIEGIRVWGGAAAQGAAYPYLVFSRVSEMPYSSQDQQQQPVQTRRFRYQVNVFSQSYVDSMRLCDKAAAFLLVYTDRPARGIQRVIKLSSMGPWEEADRVYHAIADLDIIENL